MPADMQPAEYHEAMGLIGWSGRQLADHAGVDERVVRRWAAGTARIPPPVAEWLRAAASWFRAHPCPKAPKREVRMEPAG